MFKLPELNYDFDAMTGWVGAATMEAHHDHHHATYVDKLNAAIAELPAEIREQYFGVNFASGITSEDSPAVIAAELKNLQRILTDIRAGKLDEKLDAKLRTALINHGGGHFNHSLFWKILAPKSDGEPRGELAQKLSEKYGSFQNFVNEFEAAATGVFGSGWAWLNRELTIETSAQQNLASDEVLLGLDVWEHAYYLDYKWARADYIKAWWNHVDWDFAAARFAKFGEN